MARPNIDRCDVLQKRKNDLLDRRQLTNMGPFVRELEAKLEKMLGVKHVICISNGTIALKSLYVHWTSAVR